LTYDFPFDFLTLSFVAFFGGEAEEKLDCFFHSCWSLSPFVIVAMTVQQNTGCAQPDVCNKTPPAPMAEKQNTHTKQTKSKWNTPNLNFMK
jgi:hypothetical protein